VFTRTTSEGLVAQPAARPAAPPAPRPIPTPTPQNNGNGNSSGEGPGQGGGIATGTFQIGGQVAGLYPGAARPMVVTFTNPAAIAIRVTQLDVIAASSNHIGCTAQDLLMPDSAVDVVVPAGSSTTHTVYVGMIDDADNACQGASWALSFSGTAVQA
jgi:hypothetical protein